MAKGYQRSAARRLYLPVLITVGLIAGTFFLARTLEQTTQNQQKEFFDEEVTLVERSIVNRADIYINALRSGIAFFGASDEVTRKEWEAFVNHLELADNFPGIQGYGYSQRIDPGEKEAFIESVRAEGFPEFDVRPSGSRNEYTSILFLEPFDERNQQAFGFDMFSEETRRTAMSAARDTGDARLSGRVTLVQEIDTDVQAGFLIYLPLYEKDFPQSTVEERRAAHLGYVYAPFRADNFMEELLGERKPLIDFAIVDGDVEQFSASDLIYDSSDGARDYIASTSSSDVIHERRTIEIAGRTWTIFSVSLPSIQEGIIDQYTGIVTVLIGSLVSILIGIIMYVLISSRERAQLMALSMTEKLRQRTQDLEASKNELEGLNEELEKKTEELASKIDEVERTNEYMLNREKKMAEMKKEIKDDKNAS